MPARNVVVAQSGGPTCVINNSLRGIIESCRRDRTTIGTIFAGHFGIEGVPKGELLDLSSTSDEEIALLRTSPVVGGIGTCRYMLKKGQIDVTDDLLAYARPPIGDDWVSVPLVDDLARFSRITKSFAPKRLKEYLPQTYRKG